MAMIGIRREDKNLWERRVPLVPEDLAALSQKEGLEFTVQPSDIRVFDDDAYRAAGASVKEDLSECPVVMAVKEIPAGFIQPERTYVFFSHTIKGQKHNMAMLRKLIDLRCSLIDYEKVTDERGRRLIFFGRHAGLAGMIDSLWAVGQRWNRLGETSTPFAEVRPAHAYPSLLEAKKEIAVVGDRIREEGLPGPLLPFVCGFAGYGNVSQGAQEIYDLLPTVEVTPEQLTANEFGDSPVERTCFKVVFEERHMARPSDRNKEFALQEYYDHPERYEGCFDPYLDHLSVLVNCIYWDERYPRLVTKDRLARMHASGDPVRLILIGDITCDIEGSIEATVRSTDPDDPVYVYNPVNDTISMGFEGKGTAILAVDNLPCELSLEASRHFSASLAGFMGDLARADMGLDVEASGLPGPLKRGLILHRGAFAPEFRYMEEFLNSDEQG